MKILYIVQHFNIPTGSAGIRPYKMAKALVDHGHEVIIICGSYDGANTGLEGEFINGKRKGFYEEIEIIEFDLKYSNKHNFVKRSLVFLRFILKTIIPTMTLKYDILFASSTPLTVGVPAIFGKIFRRKKFVFEVRDLWPELPKEMGVIKNPLILGLLSFLEYITYHSADKLIGLSPGISEGIKKRGIKKSKITTISNGCDLDLFKSKSKKIKINNTSQNDFLCLYCGTHGIANGLSIIPKVAKYLIKEGNKTIKFVLVGNGSKKKELLELVEKEKLNNIIFLDPVDKKELAKIMNRCDLGMQLLANFPAFYYGTSPNKFFDYISASLPVLNNYPGWVSELIIKNKCGIAVKPDDPIVFGQSLIKIEKQKNKLIDMSKNAYKLAESKFDINQLSKKWVEWVIN
jgi:glycosyltransferase involved in cell wall biosynthesis